MSSENKEQRMTMFACMLDIDKLKSGDKHYCQLKVHELFKNDAKIKQMVVELGQYLRENYDMHELIRKSQ